MKYKISIDDGEVVTLLLETNDKVQAEKWVSLIQLTGQGQVTARGVRGVPLVVTASTNTNFQTGMTFAGTATASKALGFGYDRVSIALSTAKSFGRDEVSISGVTLKRKTV